jgi:signal transduction histidine kinase
MNGSFWQPIHLAGTALGGHRHVCGFFDGPEDESRVTLPFVREGLERKELAFHIVDPASRDGYVRRLEQGGIPFGELESSGQFELRTWSDTYLRGGEFDPDAMLALFEEILQRQRHRFPLVRLVAHVDFPSAPQKTWDDWVAYEARLNSVLPKYPDPVVCAYDASKYSGALLMDLLRTHPVVIAGGVLHANPFFVPPDEFLLRLRDRASSKAEPEAEAADEQALAIVSHDLRSPLSAIMLGASVLRRESGLSAEAVRIAKRILVSAQRMEAIISDLLDLTKIRLGVGIEVKRTPIDAHELCARIVEELQGAYPGREIRLRVEGDGTGQWDASRLEQVVSNLVANALQHSPDDAPVTVASQGSETEWRLSVHNLGEPIPPEALAHLFDPFRRGDDVLRRRPGRRHLGIGLFIVCEVVHAHDGTVEVTSGSAEGTRFVARLPRS